MHNKYNKNSIVEFCTILLFGAILTSCAAPKVVDDIAENCRVELIVLGIGQDAGAPQIGNTADPAWHDPSLRLSATALALIDHETGQRFLFEAAPQISAQLNYLDRITGAPEQGLGVDGVFLTHAHIGHYVGLMFFGREAAGAANIPVYAMPRLGQFLRENGPWSQLVALGNIRLEELADRRAVTLSEVISVTPYQVPHRDEYSETVGYIIRVAAVGDNVGVTEVLFVPDIDDWSTWKTRFDVSIEDLASRVDYAFVDATFFDDNELPGRDMSKIPHPRVLETMERLRDLPAQTRKGVHFIHINHTNPIRYPDSEASRLVRSRGFSIAREGQAICLATTTAPR